jgi:hypothetical protein
MGGLTKWGFGILHVICLGLSVQHKLMNNFRYVRWVPCHHGMARPQVADGGDALQFWRQAANILNKPTRGGPPAWGLGVGLTTTHRKK